MARKIPGTTRGDNAYFFSGDEIANLPVSAQVVRWQQLTESHVSDLATKIAAEGQRNPVWIRKQANGMPELLDGRHRRAAVLQINAHLDDYGLEDPLRLSASFHDLDDEQCLVASFRGNDGLPMTPVDLASAVNHMTTLGWDGKRIAAALSSPHRKLVPSRVSRLKHIHRLPHDIKLALHTGKLPEQTAFLIMATGGNNEELLETYRQLAAGELSKAELRAKIDGKQRAEGKLVKRTVAELVGMLGAVTGKKSAVMLQWLAGHEGVAGEVLEIFREDVEDHSVHGDLYQGDHNVDSGRSPGVPQDYEAEAE